MAQTGFDEVWMTLLLATAHPGVHAPAAHGRAGGCPAGVPSGGGRGRCRTRRCPDRRRKRPGSGSSGRLPESNAIRALIGHERPCWRWFAPPRVMKAAQPAVVDYDVGDQGAAV